MNLMQGVMRCGWNVIGYGRPHQNIVRLALRSIQGRCKPNPYDMLASVQNITMIQVPVFSLH